MDLWEKCVDFHGHHCGGLRIGYAAAEYAMKLLNISFSDNEQVVCISENDACGVDAIQVMLGCRFDMAVAHVGRAFVAYTKSNPLAELYLQDQHHPSLLGGTLAARTILVAMLSEA